MAWFKYKKPSLSLTLNGVLAGLVGITAGCDLVDPVGASSVHGVCGCLGTILSGLFATGEGLFYCGSANFLMAQIFGALVVGCWAAFMGFVVFKGLDIIHGLRVPTRVEEEGLDIYEHGETAYNN